MRSRLQTFVRQRSALVGALVTGVVVLLAVLAPLLTPFQPLRGTGVGLEPPGAMHLLGTDDLGHDVLAQVLYGARVSITVGLISSVIAFCIGLLIGAPAGYFGGFIDDALMRFTEFFQVIPRIFLAILLVALFGQNLVVTVIAIGVLSWPASARVLRAEVLSKREAEYVSAARAAGARAPRLIVRHILPNAIAPLVVTASLNVGAAILLEAGLAFLGLSDPNQVSLGRTLQSAIPLIQVAWWVSVFPGLTIAVLVVAVNLLGDGVNDLLDPRRRALP